MLIKERLTKDLTSLFAAKQEKVNINPNYLVEQIEKYFNKNKTGLRISRTASIVTRLLASSGDSVEPGIEEFLLKQTPSYFSLIHLTAHLDGSLIYRESAYGQTVPNQIRIHALTDLLAMGELNPQEVRFFLKLLLRTSNNYAKSDFRPEYLPRLIESAKKIPEVSQFAFKKQHFIIILNALKNLSVQHLQAWSQKQLPDRDNIMYKLGQFGNQLINSNKTPESVLEYAKYLYNHYRYTFFIIISLFDVLEEMESVKNDKVMARLVAYTRVKVMKNLSPLYLQTSQDATLETLDKEKDLRNYLRELGKNFNPNLGGENYKPEQQDAIYNRMVEVGEEKQSIAGLIKIVDNLKELELIKNKQADPLQRLKNYSDSMKSRQELSQSFNNLVNQTISLEC